MNGYIVVHKRFQNVHYKITCIITFELYWRQRETQSLWKKKWCPGYGQVTMVTNSRFKLLHFLEWSWVNLLSWGLVTSLYQTTLTLGQDYAISHLTPMHPGPHWRAAYIPHILLLVPDILLYRDDLPHKFFLFQLLALLLSTWEQISQGRWIIEEQRLCGLVMAWQHAQVVPWLSLNDSWVRL